MKARRRPRTALDYFRFDVVAYLTSPDVAVMTAAQEGAFVRLLAFASRAKDCALDNDDEKLARLSKLGDEWSTVGRLVRAQFVEKDEDSSRLINEKLHGEWSEAWQAYEERCKRNKKNRLSKTKKNDDSSTIRQTTRGRQGARKGTGKGTVVPIDHLPSPPEGAADAAPLEKSEDANHVADHGNGALKAANEPTFQAEAIQDYNARFGAGSAQGGRIAGALTGLVRAQVREHGFASDHEAWRDRVQPAWRRYLAESTHPSPNPQDFVSHFADWVPGSEMALARGSRAPNTADARSHAAGMRFLERGRAK